MQTCQLGIQITSGSAKDLRPVTRPLAGKIAAATAKVSIHPDIEIWRAHGQGGGGWSSRSEGLGRIKLLGTKEGEDGLGGRSHKLHIDERIPLTKRMKGSFLSGSFGHARQR